MLVAGRAATGNLDLLLPVVHGARAAGGRLRALGREGARDGGSKGLDPVDF